MASLGSFGAALREYEPPADPDTFEFYGETFTVHGEIPAMLDLAMTAAYVGRSSLADGDAAMYEALRIALTIPEREVDGKKVPADATQWEKFSRLATAKAAPGEMLVQITFGIIGMQMGRPTGQRPISSGGSLPTSTNSSSSASDSPASPDSPLAVEGSAG